jgi:type IV pilus assembly protein PilX
MLTILSMALMKTTRLEEKMAGATRDMNLSFQAAETALRAAEIFIASQTDESLFDSLVVANGIYSQTKDEPPNLFTPLVWTDTNSKEIKWALQGVTSKPRYMIKKLKKIGCTPTVFRVTARGTGGTNNRTTLLRSHYAKVFSADSTAPDLKGPAGCNEGIKLWLDADQKYLFSEISCLGSNPASGEDVKCWKDRSGNDAHVTQTTVHRNDSCCPARNDHPGAATHGAPQYQRDDSTFTGKPYVLFNKSQNDALAHNLPTTWDGSHSFFFVVEQTSTGNIGNHVSYFSNGLNNDSGQQFQVGCKRGNNCPAGNRDIAYAQHGDVRPPFGINTAGTDQTRIYTIHNDDTSSSDKTTTYIDGVDTSISWTRPSTKFTRYLIGLNRNANRWNDFRLAELVLYDRALDNGELSDVHEYLATKYGISSEAKGYPVGRLSWEQLFPSQ